MASLIHWKAVALPRQTTTCELRLGCQNMNKVDLRIMGLYEKIERNTKLSKQLKVLAGVCLFFLSAIVMVQRV